jgi:hypothetical protein
MIGGKMGKYNVLPRAQGILYPAEICRRKFLALVVYLISQADIPQLLSYLRQEPTKRKAMSCFRVTVIKPFLYKLVVKRRVFPLTSALKTKSVVKAVMPGAYQNQVVFPDQPNHMCCSSKRDQSTPGKNALQQLS